MIVGTRGSELARTQTNTVIRKLKERLGWEIETRILVTQGDRVTDRPLRELEGRGYFTKELEQALLEHKIDVAVHSYKDMPSKSPDGLSVAAVSERENPQDLLIILPKAYERTAKPIAVRSGATIGTSAVRREAQLLALRPDILTKDLRGNVPTRFNKLRDGMYDAIVLAAAGVNRLQMDLSEFIVMPLPPGEFIPSPGQGALAIQMRCDDHRLSQVRDVIHDERTAIATIIERSVQALFGGGCGLPLGAHAETDGSQWKLHGFWGAPGEPHVRATVQGPDWTLLAGELFRILTAGEPCVIEC